MKFQEGNYHRIRIFIYLCNYVTRTLLTKKIYTSIWKYYYITISQLILEVATTLSLGYHFSFCWRMFRKYMYHRCIPFILIHLIINEVLPFFLANSLSNKFKSTMGPPCYLNTGPPKLLERLPRDKNRHRIPPKADPDFVQQALANLHHRQSSNRHSIIIYSTGVPEVHKTVHFHRSCNSLQTIHQMTAKAYHVYSSWPLMN